MSSEIPTETITAFARTISGEARRYGFAQIDLIRLVNALLDVPEPDSPAPSDDRADTSNCGPADFAVDAFPLRSDRLEIRLARSDEDADLLRSWLDDEYGRHFLLSSTTAQPTDLASLLENPPEHRGHRCRG